MKGKHALGQLLSYSLLLHIVDMFFVSSKDLAIKRGENVNILQEFQEILEIQMT